MDECDVVANFFDTCHVVRGKNDGGSAIAQLQHFVFQQLCIEGIEARKGFVEDQQLRFVQDSDDKLYLLLHTLGEFFELLVPPRHDLEFLKPHFQPLFGFGVRKSLELCKIQGLFAHFHLTIKAALFGKITNISHIFLGEWLSVEQHLARVGESDVIDDANEGGFACPIGTKQTKDATAWHFDADIVQRGVRCKSLRNPTNREEIRHIRD